MCRPHGDKQNYDITSKRFGVTIRTSLVEWALTFLDMCRRLFLSETVTFYQNAIVFLESGIKAKPRWFVTVIPVMFNGPKRHDHAASLKHRKLDPAQVNTKIKQSNSKTYSIAYTKSIRIYVPNLTVAVNHVDITHVSWKESLKLYHVFEVRPLHYNRSGSKEAEVVYKCL